MQKDLKTSIRKYKACRVEPLYMQDPNPLRSALIKIFKANNY
jgi:hypothetical protein